MVLGRADGQHGFPVTKHEERRLFAFHELFDHDLGARVAKGTVEHLIYGGEGFGVTHGDDDTLARRQTVGLDDNRRALLFHIGAGAGRIGEMAIGRRGRIAGVADFLGKGFGSLQRRRRFGGAENVKSCRAQVIAHTRGQGRFGADDDEVDVVPLTKGHNRRTIHDVELGALRDGGNARIARCHDQLVAFGVLHDRPSK